MKKQKEIDILVNNIVSKMMDDNKTPKEVQETRSKIINWYNQNPNYEEIPDEFLNLLK